MLLQPLSQWRHCTGKIKADREHLPRGIYRCAYGKTQSLQTLLSKVCWHLQLTLKETAAQVARGQEGPADKSGIFGQSSLGSNNLIKDPSASSIAGRLWCEKEFTLTLLLVSPGSQGDPPVKDLLFNLVKVNGSWVLSLPPSVIHCPDYPLGTPG